MTIERSGASFLALSCVGAFATFAAPALGQSVATPAEKRAEAPEQATELKGGVTYGDAVEEVKVDRVESPKATAELLDTPQTITVISNQTLQKQNLLTLRDALSTIPGITFGAGEGGGGYGDSINLRGYSANNDITQDGVRDSAQYSRTETFNIQQIEVYNGANSVFNGSGSVGGTINLITKTPQAQDLTVVQGAVGTDNYYRGTIDTNHRVSDMVAVRLNAVYHHNDYPGRDVEKYKRWGVAPSFTIGVDSPTSMTVQYVHQEDDNTPVYGVPYFRNAFYNGILPGVDRSDYYGIENLDKQDQVLNQATFRFNHEFSDSVSIRNLTRYQHVTAKTHTSAPQGTFCLANNRTQAGAPCTQSFTAPVIYGGVLRPATAAAPFVVTLAPGQYLPTGPRGLERDQYNDLFYTQTDLRAVVTTGALEHTMVLGGALTKEDYKLIQGNTLRTPIGQTVQELPIAITGPVTTYTGPVNFIAGTRSTGVTDNAAIYFFDTTKIGQMFEVNFGLRYERNLGAFRPGSFSTAAATLGAYTRGPTQRNKDNLFSYRGGLVFKPIETASLYASYGNSRVPTSATVRLGCGAAITAPAGVLNPCQADPEKAENIEIGGKIDLFDRKLQLTAAAFRNDRTNYRVATNDPSTVGALPVPDGHSRVDGIALGASGNITPAWSIFSNFTYLDSKVKQSVSDFCLANAGRLISTTAGGVTTVTNPCGNSSAVVDPQAGNRLAQTPRFAGSLFTTYTLPFGLQLGYGLTYQGSFAINNSALAAPLVGTGGVANGTALTSVYYTKDYVTHRAFASMPITGGLTAQVNVQNFTNAKYLTNIRNGWALPGEERQAILTLSYSM